MSVWIKCLCTFLLAACICSFLVGTAEARESAFQTGKEDSAEQTPKGLGLLNAVKGIADILEVTTSNVVKALPLEEMPSPGLVETIDQVATIAEPAIDAIQQTSGLSSVLSLEQGPPAEQGLVESDNGASGVADSGAPIAKSAVSSSNRLLPGLLDGLGGAGIAAGGIVNGVVDGVGHAVGGVVDGVGHTPGGVVDDVGHTVSGVFDGVGHTVGGVVDGVEHTVGGVVDGVGHTVGGVVDGVGHTVGGVVDGVGHTVGGVVDGVGHTVGGVVDGVGHTVSGVVDGVGHTVGGVVDGVGHTVGGVVDGVGHTVGGVVDGVGHTVGGVVDGVGHTVGGVVDGVGHAIDELIGSKTDEGGPSVPPVEEPVDVPVDQESSETDGVREPYTEQEGNNANVVQDKPPVDQENTRVDEVQNYASANHEKSSANEVHADGQPRYRQQTGCFSSPKESADNPDLSRPYVTDCRSPSEAARDGSVIFTEQQTADNPSNDIHLSRKSDENGGVQTAVASKTAMPSKPKSPLPYHKRDIPVMPPATISVKQPVQSQSGSAGGGPHLTGSPDAMLEESISFKLASKRIYAKNTRRLITKWANEPPIKPPRHILFSIMN
ncbi:hypothetical protein [Paenibacillus sp. MBLB4367]|uniref:hypothetical protein n=1 Tax=Paenibacillus sp. MBLB4367 TaxID=3384767 RepID=UPI003907EA61